MTQVPEPLSPRYRSRVREVSASYRSHGVNHVPGPHEHKSVASRVETVSLANFIGKPTIQQMASDLGNGVWVARESNPEPTD